MTLYEFWNCTLYYQPMFIYLTNAYDQNMPIFKGSRDEWSNRKGDDDLYWHLMDTVEHWEVTPKGHIVVMLRNDDYEKRMEDCYCFSKKWGGDISERPWRYSIELETYTERAGEPDE